MPRTALVILAAGASTRMGQPKQLLPIDGRPMIVRTIESALASPVWPVVVVLGANAAAIRPAIAPHPVLIADNPTWAEGMASSLRAGLATVQTFSRAIDGVLIALCDQPAFSPDTISRLLATRTATGKSIVAARYGGHLGAPVYFARTHFSALAGLSGDEGARKLIAQASPGDLAEVDLPELAHDLDTPEDYARAQGAQDFR